MARRILIALALILAAALAVSIWRFNVSTGPGLSGEAQAEFVRSVTDGCLARQKAAAENATVSPEVIASYCACYAGELSTRVGAGDLERLRGRSAEEMQAAMGPKMAESEDACLARLGRGKKPEGGAR